MNRPPQPPDRYVVVPTYHRQGVYTYTIERKTHRWWVGAQTFFVKTAEKKVGGVEYATYDEAKAACERLNEELRAK